MVERRAPQRPGADWQNQPGLFHQRNEFHRRHEPQLGALPADQRLDPDNGALLELDLGLVMQHELLVVERAPQLVLERQLLRDPLGHLLRVEQVALPRGLGLLERRLGVLEQRLAIPRVLRE